MSTVATRNPVRCFCSFVAQRTNNNIYVCGRYELAEMVCLFHLHHENLETYYQSNRFPMPLDCEMCLATIKIHSKVYIAPCRMTSIRCQCGETATFGQSKQNNFNYNTYFFGCPNWRGPSKCKFFEWAHEYQTICDLQILHRLNSEGKTNSEPPRKRALEGDVETNKNVEDLLEKKVCAICLVNEPSHLITPCNHLCCCEICAVQMKTECPLCRTRIGSIQRVFFV